MQGGRQGGCVTWGQLGEQAASPHVCVCCRWPPIGILEEFETTGVLPPFDGDEFQGTQRLSIHVLRRMVELCFG